MNSFFIAGTDTGVGKTFVLCRLLEFLVHRGRNPFVMKPVETGCRKRGGLLVPDDGRRLAGAAGAEDRLDDVCPFRFRTPVAPLVAAEREGGRIDLGAIKKIFVRGSRGASHAFVEGAGGLMVPVTPDFMMIDFPRFLGLKVILVSRLGLGAINQTLLGVEALRRRNIAVAGVILNDIDGGRSAAERTNPAVLAQYLDVPLLGVVPYGLAKGRGLDRHIDTAFLGC